MFASGKTAAVASAANYIEDVFSTYLYKGNASTQTITNGIDLSTKGGLVWTKSRTNANEALIYDTVRGVNNYIIPSSTQAAQTSSGTLTAFNSNGFTLGANDNSNDSSTENSVSWSIAKSPKFFDVVTYTGTGSNTTISHSLGSVPACIMVKRTDTTGDWQVYHRSLANTEYLVLNTTAAKATGATRWNSTTPTSTVFSLGTDATVNASGGTYVAYLFAHDAGGFGLTGTDNVISCGSLVSGTVQDINLGYEPQWIMYKNVSGTTGNWTMFDIMRGMTADGSGAYLQANTSAAEATASAQPSPLATGFRWNYTGNSGQTFIYIAIRRGPMKVPTSGTSVFSPNAVNDVSGTDVTTNFPVDLQWLNPRTSVYGTIAVSRLTQVSTVASGTETYLRTPLTDAEVTGSTGQTKMWGNTGFQVSGAWGYTSMIYWNFRRAPSFFDEVCYKGTGGQTLNHNLGVTPELIISKRRSGAYDWTVYSSARGTSNTLFLNLTNAETAYTTVSAATATTFTVQGVADASGETFVAYLFATCAGVSKVGSYTGTGTTKQVDCGFTGGARFVLIKRTDATGAWYVWDSARGIVSGNDPYLLLNSTAAEVTNTDYVDTYSAGFEISSTAPAAINASGGTFIFLAIA